MQKKNHVSDFMFDKPKKQGIMVMEIIEGKFYKTRDGRKVGPIIRTDEYSYEWPFTVEHEFSVDGIFGKAWKANGSYSQDASEFADETAGDLIEEWQDEPKKEISDMSEVKFKVGDYITSSGWPSEGYKVTKIDKEANQVWLSDNYAIPTSYPYMISPTKWEIVKTATTVPEIGTKWVFNDGQDFVVRVVGLDNRGCIVLEALNEDSMFYEKQFFTFENEPEKFGEFYKPWVEKVEEPKSLVGYVTVVKEIGTGRLDFDASVFDTEQEARDGFDSWNGAWELVDVVKVEWEQP